MPEDGPISRIVYVCLGAGDTAGGAKMIFRHVEALRELGRDAAVLLSRAEHAPAWFDHAAPVLVGPGALRPDDLVVVPEDAPAVVRMLLTAGLTPTLFCQNHHYFKAGVGALSAEVLARLDRFLAPSRTVADWLTARFPRAEVAVVPAFVDERLFRPRPKVVSVAYIPRKRRDEAQLIRQALSARAGPALTWTEIDGRRETEVAAALGSARVFLSLSRAEGLGLTPLEAMASGCLVTGFTGGGGDEYASDENGLWVSHDDVDAATDALARACALADQAGPEMQLMIEAGARTAAQWSRGVFVEALGRYWDERLSSPP